MKRLPLLLFLPLAAAITFAQKEPVLQHNTSPMPKGPNQNELYCSGFVEQKRLPRDRYILGNTDSPHSTRYGKNDEIFLAGRGYQVGERYTVVREVQDPNRQAMWPQQSKRAAALGHIYHELGFVEITHIDQHSSVAKFIFPCDTAVPGDFLIPFEPKERLLYRTDDTGFREFGFKTTGPRGRIVLGKEFDSTLGRDSIAYIDLGAKQGLKVGDYLIVTRSYSPSGMGPVDTLSLEATTQEDTQVDAPKVTNRNLEDMPRRGIGEVMVTMVTPESATVIIIRSLVEIQLGDTVQLEAAQ